MITEKKLLSYILHIGNKVRFFLNIIRLSYKLQIQDLYGENLLLIHRDWSHYVDQLRDDLWRNHPQIQIVDFDFYNTDIFNRCENSYDVLLAIPGWANVHPLLKVIPVEWDYSIPYGLLHSPQPSDSVKRFLLAVQSVTK